MDFNLAVKSRPETGKRVKAVRQNGALPGVVYGPEIAPRPVVLNALEFNKIQRAAGTSTLIDLSIDQTEPVKVLIQDVQVHYLSLQPTHVDLRQIKMGEELEVEVPLRFVGEAPAVKELAGTLMRSQTTLDIKCLPRHMPHDIEVDLTRLVTFDDMITLADLRLPAELKAQHESDLVIASVTPPLTEEQLKKLEEESKSDVSAVKVLSEEKKAAEAAAEAETAEKAEEVKEEKK